MQVQSYLGDFHKGDWTVKQGCQLETEEIPASRAKEIAQNIETDLAGFIGDRKATKGICRVTTKGVINPKGYLTVDRKKLEKLLQSKAVDQPDSLIPTLPKNSKTKHLSLSSNPPQQFSFNSIHPSHPDFQLAAGTKRTVELQTSGGAISIGIAASSGQEATYFEDEVQVTKNNQDYKVSAVGLIHDKSLDCAKVKGEIKTILYQKIEEVIHQSSTIEQMYEGIHQILREQFKMLSSPISLVVFFEKKFWVFNHRDYVSLLSQPERQVLFGTSKEPLHLMSGSTESVKKGIITLASKSFWLRYETSIEMREEIIQAAKEKKSQEISQHFVDKYGKNSKNALAMVTIKFYA